MLSDKAGARDQGRRDQAKPVPPSDKEISENRSAGGEAEHLIHGFTLI